jgi:RNA polymerase sigma factor (sigma-70 family)
MNMRWDVDRVVEQSRRPVLRFLRRNYGLPVEQAEELYHEAVVKMLEKLDGSALGYPSTPLLIRIARGLAANQARTRATRARILDDHTDDIVGDRTTAPDDAVVPDLVLAELEAMPEQQAQIFLLRTVLGHSSREVGRRFDMTPGSVDRRRDQARAALVSAMEGPEREDKRRRKPLAELLRTLVAFAADYLARLGLPRFAALGLLAVPALLGSFDDVHTPSTPVAVYPTCEVASDDCAVANAWVPPVQVVATRRPTAPETAPEPEIVAVPELPKPTLVAGTRVHAKRPIALRPDCDPYLSDEESDCEDLPEQAAVITAVERASRAGDWTMAIAIAIVYLDRWPIGTWELRARLLRTQALRRAEMWPQLLAEASRMRGWPSLESHLAELDRWSAEGLAAIGRCDEAFELRDRGELSLSRRELREVCEGSEIAL